MNLQRNKKTQRPRPMRNFKLSKKNFSFRGDFWTKILSWIKGNKGKVLIGAGVLAVIVVALILLLPGGQSQPVAPEDVITAPDVPQQEQTEGQTQQEGETASNTAADGKIRVGITMGSAHSSYDQSIFQTLQQSGQESKTAQTVDEVLVYDSQGSSNQQLQDVRSMVNAGCQVIVAVGTQEHDLQLITGIAQESGVPVISYGTNDGVEGLISVGEDENSRLQAFAEQINTNDQGTQVLVAAKDANDADTKAFVDGLTALLPGKTITVIDDADNRLSAKIIEQGSKTPFTSAIALDNLDSYVINALAKTGKLPAVFCGNTTAQSIKAIYGLLTSGITISQPATTPASSPTPGESPTPSTSTAPATKVIKPAAGEFVYLAMPENVDVSSVLFEIAQGIATGKQINQELMQDSNLFVASDTVVNQSNISEYYGQVKDQEEDYEIVGQIETPANLWAE